MTFTIKTKGLDHLVLRTARWNKMTQFYINVLGCKLERTVESLGLYQLRAGHSLIDLIDTDGELGLKGGPPPGDKGLNLDHFCLLVDPWDEMAIRLHLHHHGIIPPDVFQRYGAEGMGPSLYIDDLDGNTIELKGPSID